MQKNNYYIWGAGEYGQRLIEFMRDELSFKALIDNDSVKQGTVFCGVPVVSYAEVKDELSESRIAVAINIPTQVRNFLLAEGFEENNDFYVIHDFIPWYFWEMKNELAIKTIDIAATTMCNMRCKACQVFMPMSVNQRHIEINKVKSDIDMVFMHIDTAMNINFAVGENLLNNEISDICLYIFSSYSNRYGYLTVQTNGTVLPSDDAMKRFAESKTIFGFSNYPENIKSTERLKEKCNLFGVDWYFNRAGGNRETWIDFGDPRIVKETDMEKLRKQYKTCWVAGTGLVNGWLYLCAEQAWSLLVAEEGINEKGDAFDLRQPKTDATRRELYKVISRQPDKGYVTHCMRCNSANSPAHNNKQYE